MRVKKTLRQQIDKLAATDVAGGLAQDLELFGKEGSSVPSPARYAEWVPRASAFRSARVS